MSGYQDSARGFGQWLRSTNFGQWLRSTKIGVAEVDDVSFAALRGIDARCPGIRRADYLSAKYVNRALRFVRFLVECGEVAPLRQDTSRAHDDQVLAFQTCLRRHRGISERTISRHGCMVMRLLPALGLIQSYTMLVSFGK
ncbi:hypothetical protein [Mesorhizobium australicum]|uniref:hypothetical protein n=1 Tax=Mesorhizobium australicum TaxID=536018 RepID=UPI003336B427